MGDGSEGLAPVGLLVHGHPEGMFPTWWKGGSVATGDHPCFDSFSSLPELAPAPPSTFPGPVPAGEVSEHLPSSQVRIS